jgi:hypothetical protein
MAGAGHIDNAGSWRLEDAPAEFVVKNQELRVNCVYVPFIGAISMTESKFYARVDLDVDWVATQDDLQRWKSDPESYKPGFAPDIVSLNGMGVSGSRVPDKNGNEIHIKGGRNEYQTMCGRNFMRVRFEGEFIEAFAMESFPFDVQALTLVFGLSFFNAEELRFTQPPGDKPFFYIVRRNSAFHEWTPARLVAGISVIEDFSTLVCQLQLKRDPTPYLLRIGAPCLVINALQFAIFISPEASERVNLALTLILTFVALIYTLTTLIPMAGRATVADAYVFNSVAVAVLAVALSVGASYAPNGPHGPLVPGWSLSADGLAIAIVAALQILAHGQVLVRVVRSRRAEAAKLEGSFNELYLAPALKNPTMQFPDTSSTRTSSAVRAEKSVRSRH